MVTRRIISVAMVMVGSDIEFAMMVTTGVIEVLMMADVYIVLKIPATLHILMWNKILFVIEEVDICLRPTILYSITQVNMVYCSIEMNCKLIPD